MPEEELGRGVAYKYDVLELTADITVGELIRKLSYFPMDAKLEALFNAVRQANGLYATQSVDKTKMRVPVEIKGGRLTVINA